MLFRQTERANSDDALLKLPSQPTRVHSIPTISRGKQFKGSLDVGSSRNDFSYTPAKASVSNHRLQLQGRLTIKDTRGQARTQDHVQATLLAIQGGIGAAPTRPGNPASGAPASNLPDVESTGATSFTGVMYLQLEPLSGSALGVAADLAHVQLNVRFAPIDDGERVLQAAYSSIVGSIHGTGDASAASVAVNELNKLLAGN